MSAPRHDDDAVALEAQYRPLLRKYEAQHSTQRAAKQLGVSETTLDRLISGGVAKRDTVERLTRRIKEGLE